MGLGLGALLAGCRLSLEDDALEGELGVDGGVEPSTDGGIATSPGTALCDGNLCIDLSHPENAKLNDVDGFRLVTAGKKLIVVRTSETAFVALSSVCTHAGRPVTYDAANDDIRCPSHGSRFSFDGDVTRGPAAKALATFQTTFDPAANTLTIALA